MWKYIVAAAAAALALALAGVLWVAVDQHNTELARQARAAELISYQRMADEDQQTLKQIDESLDRLRRLEGDELSDYVFQVRDQFAEWNPPVFKNVTDVWSLIKALGPVRMELAKNQVEALKRVLDLQKAEINRMIGN
jgi:hypothetical protein